MIFKINKLQILFLLLLTVFLFFSYISQIAFVFLILIGLLVFNHQKLEYIFAIYIVSCFSGDFFLSSIEGVTMNRFLYFFLLASIISRLNKNKFLSSSNNISKNRFVIVSIFLFLITSTISLLLSNGGNLKGYILFVQNLLLLFLSTYLVVNIKKLFSFIFWIVLFSFMIFLIELYFTFDFSLLNKRFVFREINASRFSMFLCNLGVFFLITFFYGSAKTPLKIISILSLLLILGLIFISGSRTSFISLAFVAFMLGFLNNNSKIQKYFTIISLLIAINFLFNSYFSELKVAERFLFSEFENTGGVQVRRSSISLIVSSIIPENFFFGVGLGGQNVIDALQKISYVDKPAHNFLIDLFAQLGLFGFITMLYFVTKLIRKLAKHINNHDAITCLAMVSSSLILGFGETIFTEKFFWNGIIMSVLTLKFINKTT